MIDTKELAQIWAAFPLSEENDAAQLAEQLKNNPEEWAAAAEFLKRPDLDSLPAGRHEITAHSFAAVSEYDSRAEGKYEAHKDYADIQLILEGAENIWIAPIDAATERLSDYDPVKDIEFFGAASHDERAALADRKHWVILFPSDLHKPCIAIDKPVHIHKIVVKVKL
ncbi:MAG: YhcH/YjgK/YiaL family protein [Bacteroidales bacterium]|nr:YhcH/YjgK/YiaL family protein [Bacteroidales bacterium]